MAMEFDWDAIDHVTKVDPAKPLPADLGVLAGTDLILVGGSDGVTSENTLDAIGELKSAVPDVPVFQEPYSGAHITRETLERADAVAVPAVYNGDRANFVGKHVDLFTEVARKPGEVLGSSVPFVGDAIREKATGAITDLVASLFGEGYVVQNPDSTAATTAGVARTYTPDQVAGAALATETFYGFPVFYVEYSGTYGGTEDVAAAARYTEETTLLYGGGIDGEEKALEILGAGADAIVVGDCFHDDPEAFRETIPK